jgi:hypothetical protein
MIDEAVLDRNHAILCREAFNAVETGDRKKTKTPVLVRYMYLHEVLNLVKGGWYEYAIQPKTLAMGLPTPPMTIHRVRVSSIVLRGRGSLRGIDSIKFKYGLKEYWDWTPEQAIQYLIVRL